MSIYPYKKSDLLNHLKTIVPDGFKIDKNGIFYKNEPTKRIEYQFFYNEYFPHSVYFFSSAFAVRHHEVEEIFATINQNHPNAGFLHSNKKSTFLRGGGNVLLHQMKIQH